MGGMVPMNCHWSGIAEIGVAIPMYVIGAVMTTNRFRKMQLLLSLLGMMLGGLAVAFPTVLIGVCKGPTMSCGTVMKPLLILLGGSAIVVSGVGFGVSVAKYLPHTSIMMIVSILKRTRVWKGA